MKKTIAVQKKNCHRKLIIATVSKRQSNTSHEEDLLFYLSNSKMWKYLRSDRNILQNGWFWNCSTLQKEIKKRLELLEKVLEKLGCLLKCNIMNKQEFLQLFAKYRDFNYRCYRATNNLSLRSGATPQDEETQKDYYYSGSGCCLTQKKRIQ